MYGRLREHLQNMEQIKFGVTRDSIIFDGNEYGMEQGGFYLGLAAHLHDRQITSVAIYQPVEDFELDAFLNAMALDPNELRRQGGVEDLMDSQNVKNMVIKRLEVEALADEIIGELDFDEDGEEVTSPEEMYTMLRGGELSANETEKIVLRMRKGPVDAAKMMVKLSDIAADEQGDPSLEGRAAYVAQTIEEMASVAAAGSDDDKAAVFENIAAGLNTLSDDFKSPILEILEGRMGSVEFGPELMEALNMAINMAAEQTTGYQESGETVTIAPGAEDIRLSPEEVYYEFTHFYDDLPEDLETAVQEEIAAIQMDDVERQAMETFVEILIDTEDEPRLRKTADSMVEAVNGLLRGKRIELAAKAITALRAKGQELAKTSPELVEIPRGALLGLADADNLPIILDAATRSEDELEKKSGRAILDMLGAGAVPGLLSMIGSETNTDQKAKLIKIAAHAGEAVPEIFERRLQDPDERVVRAVILVACELEPSKSAGLLRKALKSESEAIRIEAVRAVTRKEGDSAASLIMPSLDDISEHVQETVLNALIAIRSEAALPKLIAIAGTKEPRSRNLDKRVRAIEALGAIGNEKAIPFLQDISKKRALLPKSKILRNAAADAIARIQPVPEGVN
jgi:hypothetical protein